MTVSSAKRDAFSALEEREPALLERFQEKLNERRQEILSSEEDRVR